ncbi:MAG: FixH family protein [Bacteroidales bacterium]|nr:FixH family protein [Bacteroidales bacterium]
MRFTWGTGIFLFLVVFVLSMASFIIFAVNQDVNLVNKEYYQKGVKFDDEMLRIANGKLDNEKVSLIQNESEVFFEIDEDYYHNLDSVKLEFYRPSDRRLDLFFNVNHAQYSISKNNFKYGRYIVKMTWLKDNHQYKIEQELIVK